MNFTEIDTTTPAHVPAVSTSKVCQVENCGNAVDASDLEKVTLSWKGYEDVPGFNKDVWVQRCESCRENDRDTLEMEMSAVDREREIEQERLDYNEHIKRTQGFDPADYYYLDDEED